MPVYSDPISSRLEGLNSGLSFSLDSMSHHYGHTSLIESVKAQHAELG